MYFPERCCVSRITSLIPFLPVSVRATVVIETPGSRAISLMVTVIGVPPIPLLLGCH